MTARMRRGKQQVLLNYLPGKTFDFERNSVIARVDHIRGTPRTDVNGQLILSAISEYASAWAEEHRPALRDDVLERPARFVLIDPREVKSTIFPSVFWCQNQGCGRVVTRPDGEIPQGDTCPSCRSGRLSQLRFVRVHRCGSLQPLYPFSCRTCHTPNHMALDTRGSERLGNFRWVCLRCKATSTLFAGRCRECEWSAPVSGVTQPANADIEVHRAGRTFYPHNVVLLNQPGQELNAFLSMNDWQLVAGAAFLNLPELGARRLTEIRFESGDAGSRPATSTNFDEAALRDRGFSEEQIRQFLTMQAELLAARPATNQPTTSSQLVESLVERTGVPQDLWRRAGQEMLEAVLPLQSGTVQTVDSTQSRDMGFERVSVVVDFPVTSATFGYSRVDYQPNRCRLNPFPPDRDHDGRYPIFVDLVQADALLIRLDPERVGSWLQVNGYPLQVPPTATDDDRARDASFVRLFDGISLRETLKVDRPRERMVFGLLHSLNHLAIRQAALLCGLDSTSLSEYVQPRALTFALYCNHRFGATIGALVSLFEQSLVEWLDSIGTAARCVYDPVCARSGGSCHACVQLAETSCRFFNLNLTRSLLFGGRDPELGEIRGYFEGP